jgi:integrating conjugative element protein (TIGR03752 family)
MKANGLLKWLLIPVLLLAVWVVVKLSSHRETSAPPQAATTNPLTRSEIADLGIPADTPRDTVATLVAQVEHLQGELETSVHETKAQKAENDALRQELSHIDGELRASLRSENDHWQRESEEAATDATAQAQTGKRIDDLEQKVDALTGKGGDADLPIGLGLRPGDGSKFQSPAGSSSPAIRWIDPLAPPTSTKPSPPQSGTLKNPFQLSSGFDAGDSDDNGAGTDAGGQAGKQGLAEKVTLGSIPVYTLPANSTLMGSVAMTALIGRIPVDGTVSDPYPFKVLIGKENLTANGIDLPNVAGAVMSGTASGDWTLSCVRGRITSITFVFRDGTVRTVPSAVAAGSQSDSTTQGGLGWISDPYGIPCVSGERRSNAKQYLGSQMLITAAGAGAASLIRNQDASYSYVAGGNGSTLGTVGISGNEAMGRILAGGVEAMSQWVNKLYGQAFAAIYVPPGAKVAVHIVRSIDIDYEPHGRRVRYEGATSGASHLD